MKYLMILLLTGCVSTELSMDELLEALETACEEEPLICRNHHRDH